jgi:hypothetical protein
MRFVLASRVRKAAPDASRRALKIEKQKKRKVGKKSEGERETRWMK